MSMKQADTILKENGLRITKARVEVLTEYLKTGKPLSIFDFKKKKIFSAWNESSLYRNITKLEEAGIIRQIPSPQDFKIYELNSKTPKHHHHHIICSGCKSVQCLTSCSINSGLTKMADEVGFVVEGHSLEVFGLCPDCQ